MNSYPPPPVQPVQHPCYQNPRPASRLKPEVTFTLKHIKMCAEKIPANYPYALPPIDGLYRNTGMYEFVPVPFFEFRGTGAPPADIGTPGDVYIDLTPGARALYTKPEEDWARWAGPASLESLSHPHFVDEKRARYVWFHPEQGVEWVCVRTVMRRQEALRTARMLNNTHSASAQANLDLASTIIGTYLAGTTAVMASPSPTPSAMSGDDLFASESEGESDALSDFYPSKRARLLASGGNSISAAVSPRRAKAPPPPPRNPGPDRETARLDKTLAALQADKQLEVLRKRKSELMASLATAQPRATFGAPLLQALEKEYCRCHPSASPTPAEAKQALPDLRCLVDEAKKTLLATKMRRAEVESQLAQRMQRCAEIRQTCP